MSSTARRVSVDVQGLTHGSLPIPSAARVGNLIATGGVRGVDPVSGQLPSTLEEQCQLMLKNLLSVVRAAGGGSDTIVRIDVMASDRSVRPVLDRCWVDHFPDPDARPARHLTTQELPGHILIQATALAVAVTTDID